MGLEPTTYAVTGRRCNQLNYTPAKNLNMSVNVKIPEPRSFV